MTLWASTEFVDATGGRLIGDDPGPIADVSFDTRTLVPGSAFFAISGERFDGHDFASQAMRAGAAALVISEERAIPLGHLQVPKIVVSDVLGALENVGRAARARSKGRIAAVTGSVGKTTTKEMLRAALSGETRVHAADRSFNNHWGVPLTLARLPGDADYGVFEIGMNHPGEITPLVGMVRPDVAAITRIAPAHLGHFASVKEIAHAKAEIFSAIVPGGTAVLNRDDDHFTLLCRLAAEAGIRSIRTFGTGAEVDVRITHGDPCVIEVEGTRFELRVPLRGAHNAMNAACAVAVATALGHGPGAAVRGIEGMDAVAGRGTVETVPFGDGTITLVDESYNANPVSMVAALDVLRGLPVERRGRRVAILGDMRELGRFSHAMHADLDTAVIASQANPVLLVGEEMKALAERLEDKVELYHRPGVEAIEPVVRQVLRAGDVVVAKASNGTGLGRLVEALRT